MPVCKYCDHTFDWAQADGKFVPLIPVGEETPDMPREYVDEDGILRVGHRLICTHKTGGAAIGVTRLKVPVYVGSPTSEGD